jgi:hypothetical protein
MHQFRHRRLVERADARRAVMVADVRLVFVQEVVDRAEHRVGRRLAQAAQAGLLDHVHNSLSVSRSCSVALPLVMRSSRRCICTVPTRQGTHLPQLSSMQNSMKNLATSTMHERSSMMIKTARPHDRPQRLEALVIHRRVEMRGGDAAAGRAARLRGLEGQPIRDAAADVVDDLAQGDAHRHLDQPGRVHLARQGENLGALALGRADGGKPRRAMLDDGGDAAKGLDVVDQRRLAPQPALRRDRAGAASAARASP